MKRIFIYLPVLLALLLSSCGGGSKKKTTMTSGTITLMCDNSFENILQQEIDVFEFQYPEAHILARYIPQKDAIDSLLEVKTKAIVIARDLNESERKILQKKKRQINSMKIAVDALALIVNPENTVEVLSKKEIGRILTGELANWNDVEPSELGEIKVVFDDVRSSTVEYMRDSLMNGQPFGKNVFAQGSIEGVFKAVKEHKNAIGIIGVSWITTDMTCSDISTEELVDELNDDSGVDMLEFSDSVKVLSVMDEDPAKFIPGGRKPYQEYIYDGSYPLFRQIYMIITSVSGTLEHGFYTFVTSHNGQKLILKTGVMPAVLHPQIVDLGN